MSGSVHPIAHDVPDPEDLYERKTFTARNVRIAALIERGIATFSYTYDFGDNWRHTITVEAVEEWKPQHRISALHRW
ncbi:IS1096 element passenger TnpR family protein [Sinorhizobium meliloti]|uniref:IS1096 element passenger TnpR family protein n=1 Tax=Rhizobium meliloti TaxID=382 RepID=UPI0022A71E86|nr:hypothetical protein [Sinorhizobium meliloti]